MSEVTPPKQTGPSLLDLLSSKGWIGKIDWAFLALAVIVPMASHFVLAWPLVPTLLTGVLVLLVWLVMLAYRIAYFIIMVQVTLDAMPATSARLAVKFLKSTPMNVPSGA